MTSERTREPNDARGTQEKDCLLDVNVLLALVNPAHVHHERAHAWVESLPPAVRFATSPVTETALIRLLANPAVTGTSRTVAQAVDVLRDIRLAPRHTFVPDDCSLAAPLLDLTPAQGFRQVTDFHLLTVAARHGMVLATLDARLVRAVAATDAAHVLVVGPVG